jgi:catechol 2,3-dioxygenase-like lactoylglutathione lyase family enzyme
MITGVGSVAVLVNDAKKSAEWYRDKLGFEIVEKGGHAVFVRPRGSAFPLIHLCERCDDWGNDTPGGRTGVWLDSGGITLHKSKDSGFILPSSNPDNVERTFDELKKNGVEFSQELTAMSWGKMAIFKDPDGNEFEIS